MLSVSFGTASCCSGCTDGFGMWLVDMASASEVLGAPVLPSVMVKTVGLIRELSLRLLHLLFSTTSGSCSDDVVNVVASVIRPLKIGKEFALLRNWFISSTSTICASTKIELTVYAICCPLSCHGLIVVVNLVAKRRWLKPRLSHIVL